MSEKNLTDGTITTEQDFEALLADAVEQAITAGIDVRGAWEFETGGSVHNWEIEVLELHRDYEEDKEA